VQDTVGSAVDQAKQQVSSRLTDQVDRASQGLGSVAKAVHAVGRELRDHNESQLAGYADQAASQVERLSTYLRGKDMDEIVYETENMARRQPAMFLGGAFALGLVASRFLKASPQGGGSMQSGQLSRGFGSGYGGSSYGSQYGGSSYGGSSYGGSSYGGSRYAGSDASAYGSGYASDGSQQQNYGSSSASSMGSTGGTAYAEPGSGATSDQGVEHGGV